MVTSTTTIKHILHFQNDERMSYAAYILDQYHSLILEENIEEAEFDGEAEFEVYFTTSKLLPATAIKKIIKDLDPVDSKFNYYH